MKISIFVMIFFILSFFAFAFFHENAHKAIFRFDGIESTIHWSFPSPFTVGDEPCKSDWCFLAQSMNEVVSYNLMIFYFILTVGLIAIIILLEQKNESDEWFKTFIIRNKVGERYENL